MPDTATVDSPALTKPVTAAPMMKFGDVAKGLLDQFVSGSENKVQDKPVVQEPEKKPDGKPTPVPAETKVERPAEQPEKKLDDTAKPIEQKPATAEQKPEEKPVENNGEKKKFRVSDLSPEGQEFIKASDAKKYEAFEIKNERIKELEARLDPLEKELTELRPLKEKIPTELEQLRRDLENERKGRGEIEGKLTARQVFDSPKYKREVGEPWQRDVWGALVEIEKAEKLADPNSSFDPQKALAILRRGDRAEIAKFSDSLSDSLSVAELATAMKADRTLMARHREYETDAPEQLKRLKQEEEQETRQNQEARRVKVRENIPNVEKTINERFPFMKGVEGNEPLNNALAKAKKEMDSVDLNDLNPENQAYVLHAATTAPIIIDVLDATVKGLNKQLEDKDKEHGIEIAKKDEEIKQLNARIEQQNGTALVPGRAGRDANGKFASTAPTTKDMVKGTIEKLSSFR